MVRSGSVRIWVMDVGLMGLSFEVYWFFFKKKAATCHLLDRLIDPTAQKEGKA